jgi:transposase
MLRGMSQAAISLNGRVLRHPGDLEWLERRRLQAAELFAQGKTRTEVAGELGVSAQTASRWWQRWYEGGVAGMRTARQGKPAQLGPAGLAKIRRVLDRGAVAAGFDNDLWTLARVAEVIERVTGVAHHPGHVWRILKAMRWSLQRPARKAVERNERAIARWVAEEWPRLVQTPKRAEPGFVSLMNRE